MWRPAGRSGGRRPAIAIGHPMQSGTPHAIPRNTTALRREDAGRQALQRMGRVGPRALPHARRRDAAWPGTPVDDARRVLACPAAADPGRLRGGAHRPRTTGAAQPDRTGGRADPRRPASRGHGRERCAVAGAERRVAGVPRRGEGQGPGCDGHGTRRRGPGDRRGRGRLAGVARGGRAGRAAAPAGRDGAAPACGPAAAGHQRAVAAGQSRPAEGGA